MIDSHCHLDFPDFNDDRAVVLQRCSGLGIHDIIVPAVSAETFSRTISICETYESLHLALGLHPIFIKQHQPQDLNTLNQLIEQHKPIAVGEIGLDFYLAEPKPELKTEFKDKPNMALSREKQLAFFSKQLIIAKHHQLPVIIHNRKAHDECISLLKDTRVNGGIIHAFNGSIQQAQKYMELGFLLGFGGMLTFARSSKLKKLAEHIPLEAIALETDAPDMTVQQHKGERNSPEYLPYIQSALADIKNTSSENVAKTTTSNVRQLFKL
jgi:TatD DNase family protein